MQNRLVSDGQPHFGLPDASGGGVGKVPGSLGSSDDTPEIGMRTVAIDLSQAGYGGEGSALLLNISGNAIRASLLLDTSANPPKVTTDGYAFIKLNSKDGFNPVTLFHTVHGTALTGQAAIWFPQQANRVLYLTYWADTKKNPLEMQRG